MPIDIQDALPTNSEILEEDNEKLKKIAKNGFETVQQHDIQSVFVRNVECLKAIYN